MENQDIYVHDKHEVSDDGNTVYTSSLNTFGEIRDRESLVDAVSQKADIDSLSTEVGNTIGTAFLKDGVVQYVELNEEILEKQGY